MFTINIATSNDAFVEDPYAELDRILDEIKRLARTEGDYFVVHDINGNAVATVEHKEE